MTLIKHKKSKYNEICRRTNKNTNMVDTQRAGALRPQLLQEHLPLDLCQQNFRRKTAEHT